jgi:hypothetical protein
MLWLYHLEVNRALKIYEPPRPYISLHYVCKATAIFPGLAGRPGAIVLAGTQHRCGPAANRTIFGHPNPQMVALSSFWNNVYSRSDDCVAAVA